ncbi:MAG: hypothetical protein AAF125_03205 [Chloroflexota bacterium]
MYHPLDRWLPHLLIAAFGAFALAYSLGPIFEGPDEIEHYRYSQYLARERALPPPDGQMRGQFHHTPLYYSMIAPVLLFIDDADFEQIEGDINPYSGYAFEVPGRDNKTSYLSSNATTVFPYTSPTSRAVHIMRLFSVACGLATVFIGWRALRLLWPDDFYRSLLALGVLVSWHQFAYLSGMVTNDVLVTLMATAALYAVLWMQRNDLSWQWAVWFGLLLGLALLAKASALVLGFFVSVTILMDARLWRYVPLIGGVVLAVAGWWYLRTFLIVGDPTGIGAMYQTWPGEQISQGAIDWETGWGRLAYAYNSVWGRFGSGAIGMPTWTYRVFDALVVISGVGLVGRLIARLTGRGEALSVAQCRMYGTVLAFTLIWIPMVIYYTATVYSGNQGRFALVAVVGWAALAGWGVMFWVPTRLQPTVARVVPLVLAALSVYALVGTYFPAFRPLPSSVAADAEPLYTYGDVADLLAVEIEQRGAFPYDQFTVTLHWRALRPADGDLLSYVRTVEDEVIRRDSYPGTGTLRAYEWEPGQQWAERFVVSIPDATFIEDQRVYRLVAGLYDPSTDRPIPAFPPGFDEERLPVVGDVAVHGDPNFVIDEAYRFDGAIMIAAPTVESVDDSTEVCLQWRLTAPVDTPYSVFVHLVDNDGELVAQADHAPKDGVYPFNRWVAGEIVTYCVTADTPVPNDGTIRIGLFDPVTGERPPVETVTGERVPFISLDVD